MENNNNMFLDGKFKGVIVQLDKNFLIEKVNSRFLELLGYKLHDLVNKPFVDIIVPKDKSIFYDMAYSVNISAEITIKLYHDNGAFRYFSLTLLDFIDYKLLFGNDIRKEFTSYEYENIENQEQINNIIDSLSISDVNEFLSKESDSLQVTLDMFPIEVWIKDHIGRYVFANKAFENSTGKSITKMYMKDDYEIFDKDIANEFVTSDQNVIKSKKKLSYIFQTQNKKLLLWTEVTKVPLYNLEGKYIGIIGYSLDISHNKLTEKLLTEKISKRDILLSNLNGLVFEINSSGDIVYLKGKLVDSLKSKLDISKPINILQTYGDSKQVVEKIKLVMSGVSTEVETDMFGPKIKFVLEPYKNDEGEISILGFGNISE